MIFNSGWSRSDIESLTYRELFELVDLFYKHKYEQMFDFFKMFCIANAESTAIARSEDPEKALRKYAIDLKNRKLKPEEDSEININDQFEEVDFGK